LNFNQDQGDQRTRAMALCRQNNQTYSDAFCLFLNIRSRVVHSQEGVTRSASIWTEQWIGTSCLTFEMCNI